MTIPLSDTVTLSQLYHLNSEPWANRAQRDPTNDISYKCYSEQPALALPAAEEGGTISTLIRFRRSHRVFSDGIMQSSVLAELLRSAYGIVGCRREQEMLPRFARSVPSAGALFPLELYVATRQVENVPDGLFHYGVREHALEPVLRGSWLSSIASLALDQRCIAAANAVFMFAAIFERTQIKYGPRGYRYILLEAGHAAQNIVLLGAERELATLCVGGFEDARLNALVGLDVPREGFIYLVAVGTAC